MSNYPYWSQDKADWIGQLHKICLKQAGLPANGRWSAKQCRTGSEIAKKVWDIMQNLYSTPGNEMPFDLFDPATWPSESENRQELDEPDMFASRVDDLPLFSGTAPRVTVRPLVQRPTPPKQGNLF